jgi:L-aspartate oxidase
VVAKAILRRMRESGAEHAWLDARHFGPEKWRVRFPTILATLTALGIDPVHQPIPVAPACHYASGGIATDLHGRASVPRLYACGEAACTGVQGANRLASNSLLEGLVFGRRIAADVAGTLAADRRLPDLGIDVRTAGILAGGVRPQLQRQMSADAGVIRTAAGLTRMATSLHRLAAQRSSEPNTESWEATNLLTVAGALVAAASRRTETRGSHWREDYPAADDAWLGHLELRLDRDGTIATEYLPIKAEA